MATRRDQLQSYQFLLQRVISALVYRKTDPAQSPFRRAGGAAFAGVMLSVLALAVTAAIGLFVDMFGSNTDWTKGNAIIINEDDGSQYVVYPSDKDIENDESGDLPPQRLYPVLNYTSAALLAGTTETIYVNSADLISEEGAKEGKDGWVPSRGMEIGIPGAPDSLPNTVTMDETLLSKSWQVCTAQHEAQNHQVEPKSYVFVNSSAEDGNELNEQDALSVKVGESEFLIWNNHKYEITGDADAAVNFSSEPATAVAPAYVNALPVGDPIKAPPVKGTVGEDSSVDGYTIGTVLKQDQHYYVVTADGAAAITQVQAEMQRNKEGISEIQEVSSTPSPTAQSLKPDPSNKSAPPATKPNYVNIKKNTSSCITYGTDGEVSSIKTDAKVTKGAGISTSQVSVQGAVLADQVVVHPGTSALVSSGGNGSGALLLVSDLGKTFPLSNKSVAFDIFGFPKGSVVTMPPSVVNLLPPGLADGGELSVKAASANLRGSQ